MKIKSMYQEKQEVSLIKQKHPQLLPHPQTGLLQSLNFYRELHSDLYACKWASLIKIPSGCPTTLIRLVPK